MTNAPLPSTTDFALLVGASQYQELPVLTTTQEDMRLFTSWLLHSDGGNLPLSNVFTCPEPTNAEDVHKLARTIVDRAKACGGAGRLFLYFSGHGQSGGLRDAHFCLCPWSHSNVHSIITVSAYLDAFVSADLFEEIIVFFDGCRDLPSGRAPSGSQPPFSLTPQTGRLSRFRGSLVAFACGDGWRAFYYPELADRTRASVYTSVIVRGLMGGAADVNGSPGVRVERLCDFARAWTDQIAQELHDRSQIPDAIMHGTISSSMLGRARPHRTVTFRARASHPQGVRLYGPDGRLVASRKSVSAGEEISVAVLDGLHLLRAQTGATLWGGHIPAAFEPLEMEF